MSKLVDSILKESLTKSELNELWGFSKEERDAKQARVMKLEQIKVARLEIKEFSPTSLIGQPRYTGHNEVSNEDLRSNMAHRIADAQRNLPNFAKLFPNLFILKPNSTNGASINYKGERNMYLPSQFWFAVENHEVSKQVFDKNANRMLDDLEASLNKK